VSRPEFRPNSPRIALARFPARANTWRTRAAPLTMKPFQAIAAMSENRVIGQAGRIPWHLPEDFKWFKQATMGGILVMGRKTFESIGRPLPGRETVILSRSGFAAPGTRTVPSVESLDQLLAGDPRAVWIAGGAEIYSLLLGRCGQLFLTRVKRAATGDAFFPPFEHDFTQVATVLDHPDFAVLRYERKARP
jgi:dihydrofolate reductase